MLVAELHKLGERQHKPDRLVDKDAHDIYRLLVAVETEELTVALLRLRGNELTGEATEQAIGYLSQLFAIGPGAIGATMAGRAEQLVGDPAVVTASVAALAGDLITAVQGPQTGRPPASATASRRVARFVAPRAHVGKFPRPVARWYVRLSPSRERRGTCAQSAAW